MIGTNVRLGRRAARTIERDADGWTHPDRDPVRTRRDRADALFGLALVVLSLAALAARLAAHLIGV